VTGFRILATRGVGEKFVKLFSGRYNGNDCILYEEQLLDRVKGPYGNWLSLWEWFLTG
jgi:hypothetical protein